MIIECLCNGAERIFVGSTFKIQDGCVCVNSKKDGDEYITNSLI